MKKKRKKKNRIQAQKDQLQKDEKYHNKLNKSIAFHLLEKFRISESSHPSHQRKERNKEKRERKREASRQIQKKNCCTKNRALIFIFFHLFLFHCNFSLKNRNLIFFLFPLFLAVKNNKKHKRKKKRKKKMENTTTTTTKNYSLCGIPFTPSSSPGFVLLCETPFCPLGLLVQERLKEKTGRTFTITPLQRYLISSNLHGEQSGQTSRVPLCVGCNIESVFGKEEEEKGEKGEKGEKKKKSLVKTEGATVYISDEKAALYWLDHAFVDQEISPLNIELDE